MNGEGELTPALRAFMACERARRGYVDWRAVYHRRCWGLLAANPKRGLRRAKWQKKSRRLSTLPHSLPCSTIDAKELDFRVRDGIGYGLFAIITGKIEKAILK